MARVTVIRVIETSSLKKDMSKSDLKKLTESITQGFKIRTDTSERQRRPKNGTVRAVSFNESLAADLTEWWCQKTNSKLFICHIVDEFSRLSAAKIIENKKPETIMDALLEKGLCACCSEETYE